VTAIEVSEAAMPVPVKVTCCGLDPPVSVTVNVPDRAPTAAGLKLMEIVQVAAAARVEGLAGQVLVVV
jgi:hypothetical protein